MTNEEIKQAEALVTLLDGQPKVILTALLTELRDTREMLEAARKIEFPIEPDDTYHFTSVSRHISDPRREYFGKWKAGSEDYVYDSALAAWRDGVRQKNNEHNNN